MNGIVNVGFYNYVTTDSIVAFVDYKLISAKNIIRSAKEERPRSIIDVSKGRKIRTLIILTGDRYVLSAIFRKQLVARLQSTTPEMMIEYVECTNPQTETEDQSNS